MNLEINPIVDLSDVKKKMEEVREAIKKATTTEAVEALNEQLKELKKNFHDISVQAGDFRLDEKFDDIYGEVLPLNTQLGEMEDRLYALASAGQAGTDEFNALLVEAGKIKQVVRDVDEAVDLLGENRGFARVTSSIGSMNEALLSGDFVGASKRAQGVATAMKSINPAEVKKQMQGLNEVFSTMGKVSGQMLGGLLKNIPMIAKSFMSFGVSLLGNPIFLMATAVVAIVVALVALAQKLGVMKTAMAGVHKIFEAVGWVIDMIVQGLKDLTDWLGFTSFEAMESAQKHADSAKRKADAYEKAGKAITATLDEEIKIMQINGQRTVEKEIQKQNIIIKTSKLRMEQLVAELELAIAKGEVDKEEINALKEKFEAQKDLSRQAKSDIKIIRAQDKADRKKEAEEDLKEGRDNYKKAQDEAKKNGADRLKAKRELIDIELSLVEDGYEKELLLSSEKYRRMIEDIKKNEAYTAEERAKLVELTQQQQGKENARITAEAEKKRKEDLDKEIAEAKEASDLLISNKRDLAEREAVASIELRAKATQDEFQYRLSMLKIQEQEEINSKEHTESEKKLIEDRYREERDKINDEARKKEIEKEKEIAGARREIYERSTEAIQSLSDLVFNFKLSRLDKGSKEEEKVAKKQFNMNKALQLSTAVISGIQSVQSILASPSVIPEPFGSALKIARAISVGATSAMNVAKIASTRFDSSSGSGSAGASGGEQSTGGVLTPSMNIIGTAGQYNNKEKGKDINQTQEMTVTAIVPPDQITAVFEMNKSVGKKTQL